MVISTGLKILYSCIESTPAIFTFFASFFYPPSPISDLPLVWPVPAQTVVILAQ
jgi:hypothetical protein